MGWEEVFRVEGGCPCEKGWEKGYFFGLVRSNAAEPITSIPKKIPKTGLVGVLPKYFDVGLIVCTFSVDNNAILLFTV